MSEATTPPPLPASIPAGTPRARPPILTFVVLAMGVFALTSGVSVIWSDITCARGPAPCDQPIDIAIGMIAWGLVSFLTVLRGPVGLVALIAVLVTPLVAAGFVEPWFFLFGIVILLGLIPQSKDELSSYYRRGEGKA